MAEAGPGGESSQSGKRAEKRDRAAAPARSRARRHVGGNRGTAIGHGFLLQALRLLGYGLNPPKTPSATIYQPIGTQISLAEAHKTIKRLQLFHFFNLERFVNL